VNRNIFPSLALAATLLAPAAAIAANTVDASLIPDGTYTVKVERVVDSKHVLVVMDFSKVQPNDQLKLSLIKGGVMVFADLTTH
jgi:hypothetical protein